MTTISRMEEAETLVTLWDDATLLAVLRHQPRAWGHVTNRWYLITVAMAQGETESPLECAERLSLYVQAYYERNGTPPSRESVAQ